MNKSLYFLLLAVFVISMSACNSRIANSVKRNIENETSKKINREVDDAFKGEKKAPKPDNTPSGQNTPTETQTQTQTQTNKQSSTAEPPPPPPVLTTRKNDFIPGHRVIFADYLVGEQLGEFPSKWDLQTGSAENAQLNGENVISYASAFTSILPLIDKESYLPEEFTIEFDCYFHAKGNESYSLGLKGLGEINIRSSAISYKGMHRSQKTSADAGWRHIDLSFNKRSLKVYLNGERLVNAPNIDKLPTSTYFKALSHGSSKGLPSLIKNIRIAEGGVPLYGRLMEEGKIVTNDIYFDTGKATLKSASTPTLSQILELMQAHPDVRLSVEGHTDSDGTDVLNQKLSLQRAEAVKAALIRMGIDGQRLMVKGWGESKPIETNDTKDGKAQNRRVEFVKV